MPGDSKREGTGRGYGLQCPWSNCFPQLYEDSRAPCALTKFADFREVIDHIWKYHSFLLSCGGCGHRFTGAKRSEKSRLQLNRVKADHAADCSGNNTSASLGAGNHAIKTMTSEQDERLKDWKPKNNKDRNSVKPNYYSLCRCLFGNGIQLPETPEYTYYIPEYTTNAAYGNLGLRNIDYVRQCQSAPQLASASLQPHPAPYPLQQQPPPGFIYHASPLMLDDPYEPVEYGLPKAKLSDDSGYGSNDAGNYMDWMNWPSYHNDNIESTVAFSHGASGPSPTSLELPDWQENTEGPSG